MTFCAICTADIVGDALQRPLGKRNALVNVCVDCDTEVPIAYTGRGREYDEGGGAAQATIQKRARAVLPAKLQTNDFERNHIVRPLSPGHVIMRVRRTENGKSLDVREAFAVVMKRHGYIEGLKYVGSQEQWFLFERPTPAKRGQSSTAGDPIRDPMLRLEKHRVS